MNDRGFVAMFDAMLFIILILMASAIVVWTPDDHIDDDRDAPSFLDGLLDSKMRMSDISMGDDTMVHLSDLIALSMTLDDDDLKGYLVEVLDVFSRGRPYSLDLVFIDDGGELTWSIVSGDGSMVSRSTKEIPVTSGGTLRATLTLLTS